MNNEIIIGKKRLALNSASSLFTWLINVSVIVWLVQYLLKRVSTDEYSLYVVVMSIIAFVQLIQDVIRTGIARYIMEAYAVQDDRSIMQICSTMIVINSCIAILVFLFCAIFVYYIQHILSIQSNLVNQAQIMLLVLSFSFSFRLALSPFTVGLYIQQKFVLQNTIRVGGSLLRITLLFIFLFGISTKVIWVVLSTEIANIVVFLCNMFISRKFVPQLKFAFKNVDWQRISNLISFGSWNLLSQLGDTIYKYADPIILNKLSSAVSVTNFHLGITLKRQFDSGISSLTAPIVPNLTAYFAQKDFNNLSKSYLRYGRYMLWIYSFFTIPLIIYSGIIVNLYVGDRFENAAIVIMLLFLSQFSTLGNMMVYKLSIATGQPRPLAICSIISQVLNLAVTLFLVGVLNYGAIGSALGTFLIAVFLRPILEIPIGLRLSQTKFTSWLKYTIVPGYLPAILLAAILYAIKVLNPPVSWSTVIFYTILGQIVTAAFLFTFCTQDDDKQDLKNIFSMFSRFYQK